MTDSRESHRVDLPEQLQELAEACRVLAMEGHGDKTAGHVSLRDPGGRGFWIKHTALGLEEVVGPEDLMLLDFDGAVISGPRGRPMEWAIHACIYRARPEVNAVGHTHPFHACLMSAADAPPEAIIREGSLLRGQLPRFSETAARIATLELGERVARTLGKENVLLMRNHGITFCGRTLAECGLTGVYFEHACHAQLKATSSNYLWRAMDPSAASLFAGPRDASFATRHWNYLRRKLARHERRTPPRSAGAVADAGDRAVHTLDGLLALLARAHRILAMEGHGFHTVGAVSHRDPGGHGFWVKRTAIGMEEVSGAAELILIDFDGNRVAGSGQPPVNWPLHAAVLQARPEVNVVVFSRALNATVFSALDETLLPVNEDGRNFDFNVPVVNGLFGSVRSLAQGREVSEALGEADALFIRNTAVMTLGRNVPIAVLRALALERACRMQLAVEATGYWWGWISPSPGFDRDAPLDDPERIRRFWHYYRRKLDRFEAGAGIRREPMAAIA